MKLSSLSILIQAYNNEETVRTVLQEAALVGQKYAKDFEIILTDDGSTDATASLIQDSTSLARSHLARLIKNLRFIRHKTNQGFGKTIKEQYDKASKDFVFSIPADRQIRATILPKLMDKIDKYEMVIGRRLNRQDSFLRKFQSFLYHLLLTLLFHINLSDVNSSKLFDRKILDYITLKSESAFVDAELCIRARKAGFKIGEVSIPHYPAKHKGGGATLKTVLPTIKDLLLFLIRGGS